MSQKKFSALWSQLCPEIVIMKPKTDLCWTCQKNNTAVYRTANLPDELKSEAVKTQMMHLQRVDEERQFYNTCIAASKDACQQSNVPLELGPAAPASKDLTMQYAFDFAQQVG